MKKNNQKNNKKNKHGKRLYNNIQFTNPSLWNTTRAATRNNGKLLLAGLDNCYNICCIDLLFCLKWNYYDCGYVWKKKRSQKS